MNATTAKFRTPLHSWHARHAAKLQEVHGWTVPSVYSQAQTEIAAARSAAALFDACSWAKFSVRGPHSSAVLKELVQTELPNHPRFVTTVGNDGILACRLHDEHCLVLADPNSAHAVSQRLHGVAASVQALVQDATSSLAQFVLLGPNSEAILRQLTTLDATEHNLPCGACEETGFAAVHSIIVRPPKRSLATFHILVAWDIGAYVWERILESGHELGIVPIGAEALQAV